MVELLEQISERLPYGKDRRVTAESAPRSQSRADEIEADRYSHDTSGRVELVSRFVEAS